MAGRVSEAPSSDDRDPIELLADSFIARFRAGERPSIEEYALKYPELGEEIRALLPALVELELNQSPGGTATGSAQGPVEQVAGAAPRLLGDYLVLREVGRGGMGIVYEAVQQSLGRHVALKVLPQHCLAGSSHLERFQLEARAAARLHHTNIVPVFGVGEHEGVHYYAMQFIQGQGLDEVFEELRRLRGGGPAIVESAERTRSGTAPSKTGATTEGLLTGRFSQVQDDAESKTCAVESGGGTQNPTTTDGDAVGSVRRATRPGAASGGSGITAPSELTGTHAERQYYRSVARVALQVAEGLAYAHSQGILHRDIKPSNLLLDARGTVWVTDFGLAKAEGTDALTHTGDIVGTLRYMAPERFDGWSDPRSDVYSLGATLYELVTLEYLFHEPNRAKLIDRVVHDAPVSPRRLDKKVPRDLETIVLKAIAKEPGERYASAEHLAEDLRLFLADRPVLARRASPTEQAWRWCRRNKALAATSALAILGLVAAVIILAISNARIARTNARIARTSRDLATALGEKNVALAAARESEMLAKQSATLAKESAEEAGRERVRAEAGEAQARAAVDQFLTRVTDDALLKAPGLQALRRDLLRSALKFYDEFLEHRGDDPGLRAASADVRLRVGKIQQDLGDTAGAQKSFRAARAIYQTLAKEKPDDREFQAGLAACQSRLNELVDAIAIYEKLIKLDPTNPYYRRDLAEAYNSQATHENNTGKVAEALESHRKALAQREGLVREFPDDPEARNNLGGTLNNLGVLLERQGHQQDALAMYLRAVEQGEAAFAKAPQVILYGIYLGTQYQNVARMLRALGQQDEAIAADRRGIEHWWRVTRANPEVPVFRGRLYADSLNLAQMLVSQGRKSEATEWFGMAARALEDRPRKTGDDLYNMACAQAQAAAGIGSHQGGLTPEDRQERDRLIIAAIGALRQSIETGSVTAAQMAADQDLEILRGRGDFQALLARKKKVEEAAALARRGESGTLEEKLAAGREALAVRAQLAAEDARSLRHRADLAASQHAIGQVLADLGRLDEAEKALKEALAARDALAHEQPRNARYALDVGWTRLAQAAVSWKALRLDQFDRGCMTGLGKMEAALGEEPDASPLWTELDNARIDVAEKLLRLGLWEEASEPLGRVFKRSPVSLALGDGHAWLWHALLRLRAGDPAGFRASCAEFFKSFRGKDNKFNLYEACVAGGEALAEPDLKVVAEMVEKDLVRYPKNTWFLVFAAMIRARLGDYHRALEQLDRARPEYAPAMSLAAPRAILLHHLGRGDEAKKALADAGADLAATYRRLLRGTSPMTVADAYTLILRELFCREAHSLIDGKPAALDPFGMLARARVLRQRGREIESEKLLTVAMVARPHDSDVIAAASRIIAERDRMADGQQGSSRALALLDAALASRPEDVVLFGARAELFAQQHKWDRAAADLARMFRASKEPHPRWFLAGTWVVGPYPINPAQLQSDLDRSLPPESSLDPARPVAAPSGISAFAWKPVVPGDEGWLDLAPLVQPKDRVSAYVMMRVYAAEDHDVAALVANDDWLRLWCNGDLILAQPLLLGPPVPVTAHFRAGWNTLLAKVSNWGEGFSLTLKLSSDLEEIARAFTKHVETKTWSEEAANQLERLYTLVPHRHGSWDNRAELLASEVARRDALFQRMCRSRPKDSLLLEERGRYLAWLGKWDQALAAYDVMIHDHPDPEDAFIEYAAILLLKGDITAYRTWCTQLAERFGKSGGPRAGSMLARAGGLAPEGVSDPARLVRWGEEGVAKQLRAGAYLHSLGLAQVRAGRCDQAVKPLQASIEAGMDSAPNWYGLALAHWRLGQAAQAGRWLEKAEGWMMETESKLADRTVHPVPPIPIAEWLEAQILRREAASLLPKRLGDLLLIDRTVPAGSELRLPLGGAELRQDPLRNGAPGPFRVVAPFQTRPPTADGRIEPDEYGPPLAIDFTDDENPGRVIIPAPNPVKSPNDQSAVLYLAYTRDDLFVAVKVRDDVVIDAAENSPAYNDAVELFFDGDRLAGDLKPGENAGSREGFQIGSSAKGRKYAVGVGTSDQDFHVKTSTFEGGYIVEFRIPLATIDVDDGAEVTAPGPGSTIRFNLAIVDNDEAVNSQQRYSVLWSNGGPKSPYFEGDGAWPVDLHLARPVRYELVTGPKGAMIDAATGVFTWKTPKQPQCANVTVRATDAEKPELAAEASFTITTTARP
jgi:serine/threonine protein kinase/tetratricopeptide (TPR) repeat protein